MRDRFRHWWHWIDRYVTWLIVIVAVVTFVAVFYKYGLHPDPNPERMTSTGG